MPTVLDRPLLWKARNCPLVFLGTMHAGPPGGFVFPSWVQKNLDAMGGVCLEVDLRLPIDSSFVRRTEGTLLGDLGADRYRLLNKIFPGPWDGLNVAGIGPSIAHRVYPRAGYSFDAPIDLTLCQRAATTGKMLHFLESAADQTRVMSSISREEALAALDQLLNDPSLADRRVNAIIAGFANGDESAFAAMREQMREITPNFFRTMFPAREASWVPIIRSLSGRHIPTLIAAGAGHFPGPDGLLSLLQDEFEIERCLPPD